MNSRCIIHIYFSYFNEQRSFQQQQQQVHTEMSHNSITVHLKKIYAELWYFRYWNNLGFNITQNHENQTVLPNHDKYQNLDIRAAII